MGNCRTINMEIPFSASHVGQVRKFVAELARSHNFSKNQIDDIIVAVGEACTNAVKHGCSTQDHPVIRIKCSLRSYEISIAISNTRSNNSAITIPAEPNTENEHGYGLYLISHLMDKVKIMHTTSEATVVMTKRL